MKIRIQWTVHLLVRVVDVTPPDAAPARVAADIDLDAIEARAREMARRIVPNHFLLN